MGPRNAALGGGDACERCQWGLRWSSIRGHEMLSWVAVMRADPATGAFGGAPRVATNRVRGAHTWWR
eukprot:6274985-Pyramimonas_sp.AAC.1